MGWTAPIAAGDVTGLPVFKVLATSGVFEPGFRGGGPIRSLARIVDTVSDEIELSLITSDRDLRSTAAYPGLSGQWISRGRSKVYYLNTGKPIAWVRLWRELARTEFDLLYVNSLWDPYFTIVPIIATRLRVIHARRVLIAPRGQLSTGALRRKSFKKWLFMLLWSRYLRSAKATWHAFTPREASEIRAAIPWAEVLVNENQTSLPKEPLAATFSPTPVVRFVFIGRIAPSKNLDMALSALGRLSNAADFDIFGPLEDANYWKKCQALLDRLPSQVTAIYRGELPAPQVRETFGRYDAFVFPTMFESFGHAIAESLSASCPVLTSAETPWTGILETGGGRVIGSLSTDAWANELERWAGMTPTERLGARQAAGHSYKVWRSQLPDTNILDQFRKLTTGTKSRFSSEARQQTC